MVTKILLICGGPSPERNISLNSARSVYDHLEDDFELEVIFISHDLKKFLIDGKFLYSNTTTDFDFKLINEGKLLSENQFVQKVKENNIVFPVMHGFFGEDGQIQKILENANVAFVGSGSQSCDSIYDKRNADLFLKENGYLSVPKMFINISDLRDIEAKISDFFTKNNLTDCIIKPVKGGSSIGIRHAKGIGETLDAIKQIKKYGDLVIEKRCIGKEFTVIVLQNKDFPVALLPTEIEVKDSENIIFDTRRKYLATNETHYHCPPRFPTKIIDQIRIDAEKIFTLSHANDFIRIDGWLMNDGNIYFSDFNPISGMEQNSFIFQQASKIGMTHKEILNYIIESCAYRNNIKIFRKNHPKFKTLTKVNVIFGGTTSERQVSLLSGSNVWLKLLKSKDLIVDPFLLFKKNASLDDSMENLEVIKLPYNMVLNHTVEEIVYQYQNNNLNFDNYINNIRNKLGLKNIDIPHPKLFSLLDFLDKCKEENSYLFIALHGGFGENGKFQKILQSKDIHFNGSKETTSKLCMNKFETGEFINSLRIEKVRSARHYVFTLEEILNNDTKFLWKILVDRLGEQIIIKPNCDGSSSGVVVLKSHADFELYLNLIKSKTEYIPKNSFQYQNNIINISKNVSEFIFEEFVKTDSIFIQDGTIKFLKSTGWLELTVGVLQNGGFYHSLNPSITIAENKSILSVEEKFQGGTGINITPPPNTIINKMFLTKIKQKIEIISEKLNIKDYCRIDIFVNVITEEIIIIEVNTLPALTPSTVIFQQASKEKIPMLPTEFLRNIMEIRYNTVKLC